MSFRDCIDKAEADGDLSPEQAARMREVYEDELSADIGEDEAARRAHARLEAEAAEARRRANLQIAAQTAIRDRVMARRSAFGGRDPGGELPDLIEHFGTSPHSSVWSRYREVLGRAHAMMTDLLARFERDALSRTRNRAELDNVVREAFGEDTQDAAARELARAWREGAEYLRQRRNAAGGNTRRLDDWGLPQAWDEIAVARAGREAWVNTVRGELDAARMLDHSTGEPMSPARIDALLNDAYDAIVSGGWSKREASAGGGRRSLALGRSEARVLHFRNADSWLRIQRQFGNSDPFGAMTHHVDEMAREIASMEVLGPNPRAGLRYAVNLASKAAAEGEADVRTPFDTLTPGRAPDGLESRVRSQARLAERMFALHSGEAYAAVDGKLARVLGDAVNVTVSTKLGAAFLSAVSDPVFKKLSRAFNGMPEAGAVRSTVRMLKPGIAGDRAVAVRSGLIAEGAAQVMQGQARYIGDFAAHAWSRRLADVTLRWSLLSPWTQAGKWSSGMELMGFMGDLVRQRQGWTQLHRDVRAMLERHGFDESDWAVLRGAELYAPRDGVSLLRPEEIERVQVGEPGRAETLARRFLEMVHVEMAFGTPSASYRGQAAFFGASGRGTFLDAIIRSVSLFKSFPVTVFHLTTARLMQRYMQHGGGRAGSLAAGAFAARYFLYLSLAGAMSLQLKEIAKGRDPRPMADEAFWGAAMMQGGGLGIFGDFLFSGVNRFGGGLPETIAGPLASTGGEVINLTAGNALQLAQGEDTNAGAELSSFVRNNTPGGSIWYLRLAFERLLMDEVERAVNPDAHSRWRRLQRRYQRDYDQEYWWRPGEASPDRLPDASAALSQPER